MPKVNTPVLDVPVKMNDGMLASSGLDAESFVPARIAALALHRRPGGVLSPEPRSRRGDRGERRAGGGCPDRHRAP